MKTIESIPWRWALGLAMMVCLPLINLSAQGGTPAAKSGPALNPSPSLSATKNNAEPEPIQTWIRGGLLKGWMDFEAGNPLQASTLFTTYGEAFGLSAESRMKLVRTERDPLGYTHYRFRQMFRGLEVEGQEFLIHEDDAGEVYCANGHLLENIGSTVSLQMPIAAAITEVEAQQLALDALQSQGGESRPRWLEASAESKDPHDLPPAPELIWASEAFSDEDASNYRLVWRFDLYFSDPTEDRRVYIDASSGELLRAQSLSMTCGTGSGTTTWTGLQFFNTSLFAGSNRLYEDCQPAWYGYIHTRNSNFGGAATEFFDLDNDWNDGGTPTALKQGAITTHFSAMATLNYFRAVHGRQGFTGAGGTAQLFNNALISGSRNNACYCGGQFLFGPGDSDFSAGDDWNTLDIVGHELAHGVTAYSAGLVYEFETGALNESFSDIFGAAVERWVEGSGADWLIGEDRGTLRNMSNPNLWGQPDTYLGTNWYSASGCVPNVGSDFCGVHTNSGVQNYWYYLVSIGGTGVNDFGTAYSVSGIGQDKATSIAYRSLVYYLLPGAQFNDAREGSIRAANDLYGSCSNEAIQCGNAWHAVGVGWQESNYAVQVCGSISPFLFPLVYTGIDRVGAGGSCSTTVGASVLGTTFRAAHYVELKEGFTALAGSNFSAYVYPCGIASYKAVGPDSPPEVQYLDDSQSDNAMLPGIDDLQLFPNPADAFSTLHFTSLKALSWQVELTDLAGRVRWSAAGRSDSDKGDIALKLPLADLPVGWYLVTVSTETAYQSLPLLISRD